MKRGRTGPSTRDPRVDQVRVNIRTVRIHRRMSQVALAEKAGLAHATVTYIETGSRPGLSVAQLFRIAEALDVSPGALLREDSPVWVAGDSR